MSFNLRSLKVIHCIWFLLVVGVWSIYIQHGDISNDGALYIKQAYFFSEGDYSTALKIYDWPFFAFLVSRVHILLGISLYYSVQVLNLFLFLLASFFFLKTLLIISNSDNIVASGLVVLITSIPLIDDYLAMQLRDNGAWAFFNAGTFYYLRWRGHRVNPFNFLWQLSFLIGSLFRIELLALYGLLFLATRWFELQEAVRFKSLEINRRHLVFAFIAWLILFSLSKFYTFGLLNELRIKEIFSRSYEFFLGIFSPLPMNVDIYDQTEKAKNLRRLVDGHILGLKYYFLIGVIAYSWIKGLKLLQFLTAFIALRRKLICSGHLVSLGVIFWFSFLIPSIFTLTSFSTSGRYWVLSWWVVYLFSAVGLSYLVNQIRKDGIKKRWFLASALFAIGLVQLVTNLYDSAQSHPERYAAARYISEIKKNGDQIYTNNFRAMDVLLEIFSKRDISIAEAVKTGKYRFLVICRSKDDQELNLEDMDGYNIVKSFSHRNRSAIDVYERKWE